MKTMQMYSSTRRTMILLLSGGVVAITGCTGGPLGPMDSDFAHNLAPERTRSAGRLSIEQYKVQRPPDQAELNKSEAEAARLKAMATVDITIEQVRMSALKNNLDLQVALVDPTIAEQSVTVEKAKFDAVFTPFANFLSANTGATNATSPSFSSTLTQGQVGTGLTVPLRTGGRAAVDLIGTASETDPSVPGGGSGQNFNTSVQFSLIQPLLRGAGRDVNTASIKIAGYNEQIVETRTKLRVISELAEADRSYWLLYAVRGELLVRQQEYEVAKEQLARAERRVRAQAAPEIEVTRAQSGLAARLQAIIVAENAVLIQQRELKRRANIPGLDVDTGSALIPKTEPNLIEYALDSQALVKIALGERMELLENELALLSDAVNIVVARNNVLPGLDLSGSILVGGSGDTITNTSTGFFLGRYPTGSIGVTGSIPLGNEAAEASLRQAVLIRMQRLVTRQAREQTVTQDVLNAIDRLQAAWQKVLAARQSSILAGRTLQGEQRQFDVGARTSTDVLDAASRLADAQSAEVRAMAEYEIAQIDLAVATGTVLGSAGIQFSPLDEQKARDQIRSDDQQQQMDLYKKYRSEPPPVP
ncbi:MAG: TolC family protein [Phycisphaerales bacterium]